MSETFERDMTPWKTGYPDRAVVLVVSGQPKDWFFSLNGESKESRAATANCARHTAVNWAYREGYFADGKWRKPDEK